jgi:hypothetical protein
MPSSVTGQLQEEMGNPIQDYVCSITVRESGTTFVSVASSSFAHLVEGRYGSHGVMVSESCEGIIRDNQY